MEQDQLLKQMSISEKASLLSGEDGWHTKPLERLGVGHVRMSDGPNGLRCLDIGADGKERARPATAYPPAALTACSFDRELLRELGSALAEECRENGVDLLLGPGVNIKRHPLCGRNFEYFSEDPYLAGELGVAYVRGLQDSGVGAVVKHFAMNNQEKARLCSDSVADERARREIYLSPFEIIVKKGDPWAMMCSYNRVDGEYASQNAALLTDVLRKDWGYRGLVMSDWGAVYERATGAAAGLDLEMPGNGGVNDRIAADAAVRKELPEAALDECARRVLTLAKRVSGGRTRLVGAHTPEQLNAFARRLAAESLVLLKNENALLPMKRGKTFTVIGALARTPRVQGGGSAGVKAAKITSFLDALDAEHILYEFAEGYSLGETDTEDTLLEEAVALARNSERVLLFAGTPAEDECEGFDRPHLRLPDVQTRLIERILAENANTAVVLSAAGPLEMPWIERARAVLFCYLPGQAGGAAIADVVLGDVSPSGKLAETFPLRLEDVPSHPYFGQERIVEYRESVFVGYRYYNSANKEVLFPFGHGLSYTEFSYENLRVSHENGGVKAIFTLRNAGKRAGAEAAQVYVCPPEGGVFRPAQALANFEKVLLQPGEERIVSITLEARAFSVYDPALKSWRVPGGRYGICVGASSRDIWLSAQIDMAASHPQATSTDLRGDAPEYYDPSRIQAVSDASFEAVLGRKRPMFTARPFTRVSTLGEINAVWLGRKIKAMVQKMYVGVPPTEGEQDLRLMMERQADYVPIFAIVIGTRGMVDFAGLDGIVDMLNGRWLRGAAALIGALRRNRRKAGGQA